MTIRQERHLTSTRLAPILLVSAAAALAALPLAASADDVARIAAVAAAPGETGSADAVAAILLMRDAPAPAQAQGDTPPAPASAPGAAAPNTDPNPETGTAAPQAPAPAAPEAASPVAPAAPAMPAGPPAPVTSTGAAPASSVPASSAPVEAAAAAVPAGDLWNRIRRGFAMPDLTGKRAAAATHWYAGQPDYMVRMGERASLYLYHIVQEIERRGLPTELALLPFVESAMQPQAVSSAQAAGLWQFIPSTGRLYSLEQNLWKDERFGVIESTRAALDYLEKLYAQFGSWQLALAAYNYGEAGVERAIAYNRNHHKPTDYESLRLPRETQFYVPKLQAIKNIVADPQHFGIELPEIRDEPYFVTVSGSRDIDVATAAKLAEMPVDEFRALNPAFSRPLIIGASTPTILLPADREEKFSANLAAWQATGQPLASWTAYRMKTGESLAAVAQRAGVSEASLRSANHVPPRYLLRSGSTILVPREEGSEEDVPADMLDGSMALVPEKVGLRKVTVRVRRGDTLASIARRWHVGSDEIVAWNDLRSDQLFAGQRLTLTVAGGGGGASRKGSGHGQGHGSGARMQSAAR